MVKNAPPSQPSLRASKSQPQLSTPTHLQSSSSDLAAITSPVPVPFTAAVNGIPGPLLAQNAHHVASLQAQQRALRAAMLSGDKAAVRDAVLSAIDGPKSSTATGKGEPVTQGLKAQAAVPLRQRESAATEEGNNGKRDWYREFGGEDGSLYDWRDEAEDDGGDEPRLIFKDKFAAGFEPAKAWNQQRGASRIAARERAARENTARARATHWTTSVLPGHERSTSETYLSVPPAVTAPSALPIPSQPRLQYPVGPTLFQKFNSDFSKGGKDQPSLITKALEKEEKEAEKWALKKPEEYTRQFCEFLTKNPTVWHAVAALVGRLRGAGFVELSEREAWAGHLTPGGKYYVTRNGSSLITFAVGNAYKPGNGVAMIASHIDALTARLKPVSTKKTNGGYVQLGVAPYAGALNSTWWDRDLGIGGRVLVKDKTTGKVSTKLVKLDWPIARIPTLAPHFGIGMTGTNNSETEAVPIIGLEDSNVVETPIAETQNLTLGGIGSFAATQPPKLVRAIAGELSITDYSAIINWELELFDTQPAQTGGLEKEFIFAGRIDDKLCSWPAIEALLSSTCSKSSTSQKDSGIIKLAALFDDEEIGSLLKQGARGNFLPSVLTRTIEALAPPFCTKTHDVVSRALAHSFLLSADVTHAFHPNFPSANHTSHSPRLNTGLAICADAMGHTTTDAVSTAIMTRVAEKCGEKLQVFMGRNDRRSGGTVGPMLSAALGVRAVDAGVPQLSMHSVRATTGARDPGLGVAVFKGFFDHWEEVDGEFE